MVLSSLREKMDYTDFLLGYNFEVPALTPYHLDAYEPRRDDLSSAEPSLHVAFPIGGSSGSAVSGRPGVLRYTVISSPSTGPRTNQGDLPTAV